MTDSHRALAVLCLVTAVVVQIAATVLATRSDWVEAAYFQALVASLIGTAAIQRD